MNSNLRASSLIALLILVSLPASAEEGRFDLGVRFNVLVGNGDPTNDVVGPGLFGHYNFNERWSLGFALDFVDEFDIERSPGFLGIETDPAIGVIDSKASSNGVKLWIERNYRRPGKRFELFWGVGLGVDSIDAKNARGATADGGTFDISIDTGTEPIALGTVGLRLRVGQRNALEIALTADQHFADWTVTDNVSGATVSKDDYFLTGIHLGWLIRF